MVGGSCDLLRSPATDAGDIAGCSTDDQESGWKRGAVMELEVTSPKHGRQLGRRPQVWLESGPKREAAILSWSCC